MVLTAYSIQNTAGGFARRASTMDLPKLFNSGPIMGENAIDGEGSAGIMLVESEGLIRKIPGFLDSLEEADRISVQAIGLPAVFERDQVIWQQNDPHEGIYLIHSGRVRTFYSAPSGREVTLAYWFPGNFLG